VSHRSARLGHELTQRLAQILEHRVSDPRLRGLVIVDVTAAPDASFARVYYRTLGDREQAAQALDKAKPYIRRRLAQGLKLRRVPELDFRYDRSQDSGSRVDEILRELGEGRADEAED
jgi:ribosome-binding factor A